MNFKALKLTGKQKKLLYMQLAEELEEDNDLIGKKKEDAAVILAADGSVQVQCGNINTAKKVALELYERQGRRYSLNYAYR